MLKRLWDCLQFGGRESMSVEEGSCGLKRHEFACLCGWGLRVDGLMDRNVGFEVRHDFSILGDSESTIIRVSHAIPET